MSQFVPFNPFSEPRQLNWPCWRKRFGFKARSPCAVSYSLVVVDEVYQVYSYVVVPQ